MSEKTRTLDELLAVPVAELTHAERTRLFAALLDASPIKTILPDEETVLLVLAHDNVRPGAILTASERCYASFRATGLYILDAEMERITPITTTTETTTRRGLLGRKVTERRTEIREERRRVSAPATAWDIRGMFIGAHNVMPCSPGDSYGHRPGLLPFAPAVVHAGIAVVLSVSHRLADPVPFRAVLIGTKIDAASQEAA